MTTLRRKPLYDAIRGDKGGGGGSQHTPTEASDTLRSTAYATILDLVSEGEIKGFALGASKMGQCIALDGTLLENPDGTRNFSNVTVDSRAGTQGQDYIPGVPDVENSLSVGVELKAGTPWVTRITNTNLSAVRIILSVPNGLQKSDQSTGDVTGYTVAYKIEMSIDDGVYATVMSGAFSGKASGKYQRAHRLNLPAADDHWNIRVTRTTANAASAMIADRTDVDAEVDIIDTKFRYPNSALVSISVDASQFSSIPTRAYLLEGRIVRIPSNYDPVSRTYTGVWDGTFKPGYTNNPAWCFFDMATHKRYGLGQFLNEAMVDKWKLYTISQYCDQLVDDGNGGLEPRFTCFLYLQDKADAYKVMQDMATMFRGISYYAGSAIQAVADMPSDPVYAYDDTNVIGGKFSYSGSSRTSRQTVALVSWNDESDFSRAKVEYVEDLEGIARYGVRPTEVTAIGESRRSGAHRAGRHILFTNRLETEMVSFGVGLEGDIAAPGMIVKVTDHSRAGKRMGGRIKAATASVVTVDKMPDVEIGDTLSVNMPDGVLQERTVSGVSSTDITVGTPFTGVPAAEAVWAVEKTSLAAQLFRVVSVAENSETDEVPGFTLSCIQHAPEKFAAIDNGIILAPRPITSLNTPTQAPVTSISIAQNIVYQQGVAITNLTISWDKPAGAAKYSVEWKKDDGGWISAGETTSQAAPVNNVYAGSYQARVIAFGTSGVASVPVVSAVYLIGGKNTKPPAPVLSATGAFLSVDLTWQFPTTANVSDTSYTEVQTAPTADMSAAVVSGTVPYPGGSLNVGGMAPGETKYARVRLVDKLGNIGEWSNTVSAAADTTDTLFQPITDDITALQGNVTTLQTQADGIIASVTQETADRQQAVLGEATTRQQQIDAQANALNNTAQGLANQIAQEVSDRKSGDSSLSGRVDGLQVTVNSLTNSPAWDNTVTWGVDAIVTYSGGLYQAVQAVPVGAAITDTTYWTKIGNFSSVTDAIAALSAQSSQNTTDIASNTQAISTNLSKIGDNVTAIQNEATTRAQKDQALSDRTTTMESRMPTGTDKLVNATQISDYYTKTQTDGQISSATSAATTALQSTLEGEIGLKADSSALDVTNTNVTNNAGAITAVAGRTTAIEARLPAGTDKLGTDAAIQSEATTRASEDSALGSRIDTVVSNVADNTSAIQAEATARADADSAEATQRTTLAAQLRGSYTGSDIAQIPSGLLAVERDARATADASQVSATQALQARMPTGTGTLATAASVTTESTARASADTAASSRMDGLQSSIDGLGTGKLDASAINDYYTKTQADSSATSIAAGATTSLKASMEAPTGSVGKVQATLDKMLQFTVGTKGNSAVTPPGFVLGIVDKNGARVGVMPGRSWNLYVFSSSGTLVSSKAYDVYNDEAAGTDHAGELTADLNALAVGTPLIVVTLDEPTHDQTQAMRDALANCGGTSSVIASLAYRGAYILIGAAGIGAGHGIEKSAGVVDNDTSAWVSLPVQFNNGAFLGVGGSTPADKQAAVNAQAITDTNATVTQQGNTITSHGQSITALQNTVNDPGTGVAATSSALSTLAGTVTQQGNDITSNTSAITSVQGSVGDVNSRVDSEISARQSGDAANASAITGVQTSIGNVDSKVNTEISARQSGDSANASAITAVSASVLAPGMNFISNHSGDGGTTGWAHYGNGGFGAGAWTMGPCFVKWGGTTGQFSYEEYVVDIPIPAQVCFSLSVSGGMAEAEGLFYLELVAHPSGSIFGDSAARSLNISGNRDTTYVTGTPPAGTTTVSARVVTRGVISGNLLFWACKFEYGSKPTPFTVDAQANSTASVATSAKATADAVSGKVNASYTLMVDAGGRVSGFVAQSNGAQSNFVILADNFSIVSPAGGARTEYSNGNWRVYDSAGTLRVQMGLLT